MKKKETTEVLEIDITRLTQALWKKLWLILIFAVVVGAIGNVYANKFITPRYQASIKLYVNTNSVSIGSSTISFSSGEFSSSKSLVDTYIVILKTRSVLEAVAEQSELGYSYSAVNGMISAAAVDNTAIFKVTVTGSNPEHCMIIANTVGKVLPEKIGEVIEGCSANIVDWATMPGGKISPNASNYTIAGAFLGAVIAAALVILLDFFDDLIHSEDYLSSTYHVPVLASIPDLGESIGGGNKYGKYGSSAYGKSSGGTNNPGAYEKTGTYEKAKEK